MPPRLFFLGVLLPAVVALQLRAAQNATAVRAAGAWKPGDCADDPDYRDAMGYPCSGWAGLNCSEAARALSWVFDEAAQAEILVHCPVACEQCVPGEEKADAAEEKTTTTTSTTTTTTTRGGVPVDTRFSPDFNTATLEAFVPAVGDQVVRGPGWHSGDSDGGAGVVGEVVTVKRMPPVVGKVVSATVVWPDGSEHTYSVKDGELAEARVSERWAPACSDNAAIGAQVRRGSGWTHGDDDSGRPGTILDLDTDSATVEWASGMVGTYPVCGDASQLVVRAQRSGVDELLIAVWEEEMVNAKELLASEAAIIARATARADAGGDEAADAEAEIARAEAVVAEAEAMYELAEEHLAAAYKAIEDRAFTRGPAANDTAKAQLRACEDELKQLKAYVRELRSPDGSQAVMAVPRDPQANPIQLPLHPLRSFGAGAAAQPPTPAPPPPPPPGNPYEHLGEDKDFNWDLRRRPGTMGHGEQWRQTFVPFGEGQAVLLHRCAVVGPLHGRLVVALAAQAL